MTSYAVHFLDPRGAIALSHSFRCKDDLDALAEGVRKSVAHAIEIWHGKRLVARVKLGNAPLNSTDTRCL
jgi:hypothetical protein